MTDTAIRPNPRLISELDAAEYLGIGRRSMWSLGVAGDHGNPDGIPRVRIGRRVLYDRKDLDRFVERRNKQGMRGRRSKSM